MHICDLEFILPSSPVGVLCSGGADSSLVLYLLMQYSNQPIHILTMANKKKHFTNVQVLNNVLTWCIKKTGNLDIHHSVEYVYEQTNKQLEKFTIPYLKKCKTLYIGDTCYPDSKTNQQFAIETGDNFQSMKDRDPDQNRPTKVGPIYVPFTNYDKKKIAELYKYLEIEDLFYLTRSCESLEYIGTKHCGKCWWCKEREWAFAGWKDNKQ